MQLWEFPNCCGGAILEGFTVELSFEDISKGFTAETKEKIKKELHRNVIRARNASFGFIMAVINDKQKEMEPFLTEAGFTLLREVKNPIHDSVLKIWFLDLHTIGDFPGPLSDITLSIREEIPEVGVSKDEIDDYYDDSMFF